VVCSFGLSKESRVGDTPPDNWQQHFRVDQNLDSTPEKRAYRQLAQYPDGGPDADKPATHCRRLFHNSSIHVHRMLESPLVKTIRTTENRVSLKQFQLDSAKIRRAQKVLQAKTQTETIERALDFVIAEHNLIG
jgi:hypothetical protein